MAKRTSTNETHLPRSVSRQILARAARGEKNVVVVIKNGKPSSVWGFNEYVARKELTKTVKPWKNRKLKTDVPDPLGAVDGAPIGLLTRDQIYEE